MAGATIIFECWEGCYFLPLFLPSSPRPWRCWAKFKWFTVRVIVLSEILQQLSESSRADWSRAIMVYETIDHRNDVTCHAVPVVLFSVFRKKIDYMLLYKTNWLQFSMVYTLIDHRNDAIKFSKLCGETTHPRLVVMVPLEFWSFYDFISVVYKIKSVDHGKLWSIC